MTNSKLYKYIDLLTKNLQNTPDDHIMITYSVDEAAELKQFYLDYITGSRYVKPCPFCGNRDIRLNSNGKRVWYECYNCGAKTTLCSYEQAALDRWNDRTE